MIQSRKERLVHRHPLWERGKILPHIWRLKKRYPCYWHLWSVYFVWHLPKYFLQSYFTWLWPLNRQTGHPFTGKKTPHLPFRVVIYLKTAYLLLSWLYLSPGVSGKTLFWHNIHCEGQRETPVKVRRGPCAGYLSISVVLPTKPCDPVSTRTHLWCVRRYVPDPIPPLGNKIVDVTLVQSTKDSECKNLG